MTEKYVFLYLDESFKIYKCLDRNDFEPINSGTKFTLENIENFWTWLDNVIGFPTIDKKIDICFIGEKRKMNLERLKMPFEINSDSLWKLEDIDNFLKTQITGYSVDLYYGRFFEQKLNSTSFPQLKKKNLYLKIPTIVTHKKTNTESSSKEENTPEKSDLKKALESLHHKNN